MRRIFKWTLAGAVAAVSIPSLLIYRAYADDINAADARVSLGSRIVDTRCGPIEYALTPGIGPTVLIVHGAGGGFDQGLDFAQPLMQRGFTVISPSRFGYLRTPLPKEASPEAQADAHVCLLDALGVSRVVAIGGSAGAPSVMQLCIRHPERCEAMVLVVPLAFVPGRAPVQEPARTLPSRSVVQAALRSDFIFWLATKIARARMIEAILATPVSDFEHASPTEQARVLTVLAHILPVSRRMPGLENDARIAAALPRFDLESIGTPTLVMTTRDDLYGTFDGARYTAQQVPGAQFVWYQSGGHLWVGHQTDAWSAVDQFLETTVASVSGPQQR